MQTVTYTFKISIEDGFAFQVYTLKVEELCNKFECEEECKELN